jgi:two-component system nitrogen regulation response regulator GlnG
MQGVPKILIADDDARVRLTLAQAFNQLGWQVRASGSGATLLKWIVDGEGDVVVASAPLPDDDVFDIVSRVRKQRPNLPVIVTSAENTLLMAVNATESGAYDYIPKPLDIEELTAAIRRALSRTSDAEKARARAKGMRDEQLPLIGRSKPMQDVFRTIARLVGVDLTVLISGESGSGKRLAARAIHELGRRREGRFVVVDLPAATPDQIERDLFGAADSAASGKLREAEGGTLVLNEVGDASIEVQTQLLRALELAAGQPGGRQTNVRVIATTRQDLKSLVREGRFREDLYFRLNVATLRLPPLRERADDIPDLAGLSLHRASCEGLPARSIDAFALERLKAYDWPGNVRELENLIRRICALYSEQVITARIIERELSDGPAPPAFEHDPRSRSPVAERGLLSDFSDLETDAAPRGIYRQALNDVERPLIQLALAAARGNRGRAAELLGLNRNALRRRIIDLGLTRAESPSDLADIDLTAQLATVLPQTGRSPRRRNAASTRQPAMARQAGNA